MNRFISSIIISICIGLWSWAAPVDRATAEKVAVTYLNSRANGNYHVTNINLQDNAYYIVNLAPQGWVIVSADDAARPIIGYSMKGSLNGNNLPDNISHILNGYSRQIKYLADTEVSPQSQWSTSVVYRQSRSGNAIEPLIKVHWNQGSPYNAYCPQQKALVGCVAVAMSQAMSVQRHPSRPVGSVSYSAPNYGGMSINFDNERAYNWDDILSGANNYDEAARLMYHAGMSVKMDYGEDGSGIPSNQVSRISDALKYNFGYSNDVRYYWRDSYSGDWARLILNELSAGRAVIYNALDSQGGYGHSFNIDGYDGERYFNVNWGWGGYGDGYFSLDNLRDGRMGMNYDIGHVAVVGIGAPDKFFQNISLSHNRIEENLPAGSVIGMVMVNNDEADASYRFTVKGTYNSSSGTHNTVPFIIEDGMLKTTQALTSQKNKYDIEITVENAEGTESLTQGFSIYVEPWSSIEKATSLTYDRASGTFTLTTKHNVSYTLTNANGVVTGQGALVPLPQLTITPSMLSAGANIVELRCNDEVKTFTIITK